MGVSRLIKAFKFAVGIYDGDTADVKGGLNFSLQFREVSGIDVTYDVIEYRQGEDKMLATEKFAGLVKYSNITLTRGMTQNVRELYNWISIPITGDGGAFATESNLSGQGTKMRITLNDDAGAPAATWDITDVLPVKYVGPDLKANASELAIEKIEIAHRGIVRVEPTAINPGQLAGNAPAAAEG